MALVTADSGVITADSAIVDASGYWPPYLVTVEHLVSTPMVTTLTAGEPSSESPGAIKGMVNRTTVTGMERYQ